MAQMCQSTAYNLISRITVLETNLTTNVRVSHLMFILLLSNASEKPMIGDLHCRQG